MLEPFLTTRAHWDLWIDTLARWPGRRPELDARATFLVEEYLAGSTDGDPVIRAIREAERVEEEVAALEQAEAMEEVEEVPDSQEPIELAGARPPRARSTWLPALTGGVALAAGILIGFLVAPRDVRDASPPLVMKGSRGSGDLGVVAIEAGNRELATAELSAEGTVPIAISPGPVVVRWVGGPGDGGAAAFAWDAQGNVGAPVKLERGFADLVVTADTRRLVVLVWGADTVDAVVFEVQGVP